MDIGLLSSFIGGLLALLSPCGALLLPAFFASTVGSGPRLLLHGVAFYVGLILVLVPVGAGVGTIGGAFGTHRTVIIGGSSVLLIVLGAVQTLGLGFDVARLLPGADALHRQVAQRAGLVKTVLLGAASSVAGFCAGPILGAVLTLAAAQGDVVTAGTLLAVYGAGMVVPLLVLAALWGRIGTRTRAALRGRKFTVLGHDLHSTSVITGLLVIAVGVLFWATNGLIGVPELVPTDVQASLQSSAAVLANPAVDVVVLATLAGICLLVWNRIRRSSHTKRSEPKPQ